MLALGEIGCNWRRIWRWMQRRQFRGAPSFMLLIRIYWSSFCLIWLLRQIWSIFLKKNTVFSHSNFCCLTYIIRWGFTPFEPKYKWAHFIVRAVIPLSFAYLLFSMWIFFNQECILVFLALGRDLKFKLL